MIDGKIISLYKQRMWWDKMFSLFLSVILTTMLYIACKNRSYIVVSEELRPDEINHFFYKHGSDCFKYSPVYVECEENSK